MPEIAEVRVVRDALKKQILNKRIIDIKVRYPGILEIDPNDFASNLINKEFKDITTYGKWLIFNLGDISLLSHLRMEGKFFYVDSNKPYSIHEHVIFKLNNNKDLRYSDTRKFGKMNIVNTSDVYNTPCIKKLGYEPDSIFLTNAYLKDKLCNLKKNIKTALLDQTIINGLGNIYANEVLFASCINPERKASSLTNDEVDNIIKYSKMITSKSYELGGCTIRSYTSSLGVIGHYQNELMVHMRDGLKCKRCSSVIRVKK